MEICAQNLLNYTLRKTEKYEPEALNPAAVYDCAVNTQFDLEFPTESIVVDGRVIDIFGNLSDIEIERISKIGYDKLYNDVVEIITTCPDITDEELIQIFLANSANPPKKLRKIGTSQPETPTNPTDAPYKLRIIRINPKPNNPTNPDPTDPDPTDPEPSQEIPDHVEYTLTRGKTTGNDQNCQTIYFTNTQKVVKLTNSCNGKDYYYYISRINNSSEQSEVTLEYLDNDRFLILGSNIKIVACEGQEDNLIVIGDNNEIYTKSGNDTVRIGAVLDSTFSKEEQSDSNTIDTGSGNDYLEIFGYNDVIMGDGTDTLKVIGGNLSAYSSVISQATGVDKIYSDRDVVGGSDNLLGVASQGHYGDCKFLSFLNGLKNYLSATNQSLSKYVKITEKSDKYVVTFVKAGLTIDVKKSDLSGDSKKSSGDIDNVIIEQAFKLAIGNEQLNNGESYNIDNDSTEDEYHDSHMLGMSSNNWLISKYMFGTGAAAEIRFEDNNTAFSDLMTAYLNGEISNLVIGTSGGSSTNERLGIIGGHAYQVKGGVVGSYVEFINPWDNSDTIRLDWGDLFKYFGSVNLYGDACDYAVSKNYAKLIYCTESFYRYYSYYTNAAASDDITNIISLYTGGEYEVYDEVAYITQQMKDVEKALVPSKLNKLEVYS